MEVKYDNAIKWKHFPRYWPFVWGLHQSPVKSPHKSQWRGALMLSLICTWTIGWVNNRYAGDLGHHGAHYDVTVINQCEEKNRYYLSSYCVANHDTFSKACPMPPCYNRVSINIRAITYISMASHARTIMMSRLGWCMVIVDVHTQRETGRYVCHILWYKTSYYNDVLAHLFTNHPF